MSGQHSMVHVALFTLPGIQEPRHFRLIGLGFAFAAAMGATLGTPDNQWVRYRRCGVPMTLRVGYISQYIFRKKSSAHNEFPECKAVAANVFWRPLFFHWNGNPDFVRIVRRCSLQRSLRSQWMSEALRRCYHDGRISGSKSVERRKCFPMIPTVCCMRLVLEHNNTHCPEISLEFAQIWFLISWTRSISVTDEGTD